MTVHSSQGLASRLGFGLGRGVRFLLTDSNVALRWIKRTVLAGIALFFAVNFIHGVVVFFIIIMIFGALITVLMKSGASKPLSDDISKDWSGHPSVPRDGPDGYGYYDGYGNFRGSSNPFDED